jgi:hypothetical protein
MLGHGDVGVKIECRRPERDKDVHLRDEVSTACVSGRDHHSSWNAALPPDVRKGSAFPQRYDSYERLRLVILGGIASPIPVKRIGKGRAFPHIKPQSRTCNSLTD